jgi:hypothetical protein
MQLRYAQNYVDVRTGMQCIPGATKREKNIPVVDSGSRILRRASRVQPNHQPLLYHCQPPQTAEQMATGTECAGLVLAVIPLVVEIAKAYPEGAKTVRDTIQPKRFDDALDDFYQELFCQLFEFQDRMQWIVESLPGLSQARKAELMHHFTEEDWRAGSDVAQAFASIFPAPGELYRFETIVKRVVKQTGQLIEDKSAYISKTDAVRLCSTFRTRMMFADVSDHRSDV